MKADLVNQESVQRFMKEARVLSALNHANLAKVYAFGHTGPFMAIEFVQGNSLKKVLEKEKSIAPQRAVKIACEILEGLEAVRAAGIKHRDIKPANVILTRDSQGTEIAKIIDLGIAAGYNDFPANVVVSKGLLGTPSYMSPEQCTGKPGDQATDVYAAGCILYEMLCGRAPFDEPNPQATIIAHTNRIIDRVPSMVRIPSRLEQIISRCLLKDPSSRYQSCSELEEALASVDWDTEQLNIAAARKRTPTALDYQTRVLLGLIGCILVTALFIYVNALQKAGPAAKFTFVTTDGSLKMTRALCPRDKLTELVPGALSRTTYYREWLNKYGKDNTEGQAEALFFLAADLNAAGLTGSEQELSYNKSLELYKSLTGKYEHGSSHDLEKLFHIYRNRSSIEAELGLTSAAIKTLETFIHKWGNKLDPAKVALLQSRATALSLQTNDFSAAEARARATVQSFEKSEDKLQLGIELLALARILANQGRLEEAMAAIERADREVAKAVTDDQQHLRWDREKADAILGMLRLSEAMNLFDKIDNSDPVYANKGMFRALTLQDHWDEMVERNLSVLAKIEKLPEDDRLAPVMYCIAGAHRSKSKVDLDLVVDTCIKKCVPASGEKKATAMIRLCSIIPDLISLERKDLAQKLIDQEMAFAAQLKSITPKPSFVIDFATNLAYLAASIGQYDKSLALLDSMQQGATQAGRFQLLEAKVTVLSYMPLKEKETRDSLKILSKAAEHQSLPVRFEAQLACARILRNLHDSSYKTCLQKAARILASEATHKDNFLAAIEAKHSAALVDQDFAFAKDLFDLGASASTTEAQTYHWLITTGTHECNNGRFESGESKLVRACNLKYAQSLPAEPKLEALNTCLWAAQACGHKSEAATLQKKRDLLVQPRESAEDTDDGL